MENKPDVVKAEKRTETFYPFFDIFPSRLRESIERSGFKSNSEFAKKIGVTPQSVTKWTLGNGMPGVNTICDIAKVLGVSVDYLLGLTDGRKTDDDLKAVIDYTGLAEDTVLFLNEQKRETDTQSRVEKKKTNNYLAEFIDKLVVGDNSSTIVNILTNLQDLAKSEWHLYDRAIKNYKALEKELAESKDNTSIYGEAEYRMKMDSVDLHTTRRETSAFLFEFEELAREIAKSYSRENDQLKEEYKRHIGILQELIKPIRRQEFQDLMDSAPPVDGETEDVINQHFIEMALNGSTDKAGTDPVDGGTDPE